MNRPTTRRDLFRLIACRTGAAAAAACIADLHKAAAAAVANTAITDYKALVCVWMNGGNDSNNMIVPRTGSDYSAYRAGRGRLALPQSSLLPIAPIRGDGRNYGLHPSMGQIQQLFNSGQAAILFNVGTLAEPVTRAQWDAGTANLPPQLGSHSDQTVLWQSSVTDLNFGSGWGGRLADLMQTLGAGATRSFVFSAGGDNTFEVGRSLIQYQVSPDGVTTLDGYTSGANADQQSRALDSVIAINTSNLFERAFGSTLRRGIDNNLFLSQLVQTTTLPLAFPDTDFGNQLAIVARLIAGRGALGMKRQIFFVQAGGFDTHADELAAHAALMQQLSDAIGVFYRTTVALGVQNSVTTFTASEFSRVFASNGTGSDHGWGAHHFIVGGAVRGASLYGKLPVLVNDGPDDSGGGWIPTTSVDQYSATLAAWFGASNTDLPVILPNVGRFGSANLGFMF